MKKCFKCSIEKPLSDYYKHNAMADGHLNKCKNCTKKDVANRENELRKIPGHIEKERERHRNKYYRLNYKELHRPSSDEKRQIMKRYKEKYPEKISAHSAAQHLIKKSINNELHHWSYNKEHWTDCIELTPRQHAKLHRYIVYDPERMMYRVAKNLLLLDTKNIHLQFMNTILFLS